MFTIHHPWVFTFGILGNIISFMVFLAPLPTFIRIFKKKSTQGFQSLPYVVAIFSCMLWIYYAFLKGNSVLLITINAAGIFIESIYVLIHLAYAPRQSKISTLRLLLVMNFGGFCTILLLCHYLFKGDVRVQVYGWVCVVFSISVFAAPLSIMRKVISTKSVEFMPLNLSLSLTLTAVVWFMFGILQRDLYITLPNVVGFIFGVVQMILYGIYRKYDKQAEKQKLPIKQGNVELHLHPLNALSSKDNITPHPVPEDIEVALEIPDIKEGKFVQNENHLNGLGLGPPCNAEAQKIVDGPTQIVYPIGAPCA